MKNLVTIICVVSFLFFGAGCRKETEKPAEEKKAAKEQAEKKEEKKEVSSDNKIPEIKVGGLYAFPNKDNQSYVVMKVLALEKKVVHVRRYVNRFPNIPTYFDTANLTLGDVGMPGNTGVPHMALGIEWFWPTNPVLLGTEPVTDEESQLVKEFNNKKRK